MRTTVRLAVAVAFVGLVAATDPWGFARAGDEAVHRSACPKCGAEPHDKTATKCPDDQTTLVRSDLLVLHRLVLEAGAKATGPGGLENPFKPCVKNGTVDAAALEKLVADYAAASKAGLFPKTTAKLGGYDAKVKRVRADFDSLKKAAQLFMLDTGTHPTAIADLWIAPARVAGWKGPYLEKTPPAPVDPWGHPYTYDPPAPREGGCGTFTSYGADGAPGGIGEDQDLVSTD